MITWRTTKALVVVAVSVLAVVAVLHFWNSLARWIPFTSQWTARTVTAQRDYARQDAENRSLEAQGNADTLQRVETFHREEVVIRDLTSQAQLDARTAPDADTPLSPDLADALRRQSDGLCLQRPGLCAAAPADAS